jgi:hypothetical protein
MARQAAADDDGRQIGFADEALTERLHDDHRLDGTPAEAAILLREGKREEAELGELLPALAAPS